MVHFGARKPRAGPSPPTGAAPIAPIAALSALETALVAAATADPAGAPWTLWTIAFRSIGHRAIRRALASNPACPPALLRHLARRDAWDVASAVAANPSCPRRLRTRGSNGSTACP